MGKWGAAITIILFLGIISYATANILGERIAYDNGLTIDTIVIIPIKGVITADSDTGIGFGGGAASSKRVEAIQRAKKDSAIKGIIFEINSPGGTVVASEEIANAIKEAGNPTTAWIREIGTSGAYWIASATNIIVASPMSFTGSIGVIGSYLEFSDLMEKYGLKYEGLVTGKYKDTGSMYKDLSIEEREILMKKLNAVHDYFVENVARNRRMNKTKVAELATGMFYLGKEAKELGLVDYLGGKKEAIELTKKTANITKAIIIEYREKKGITDILREFSAEFAYQLGSGLGKTLKIMD